jgi:hypothetical protein
VWVWITGSIVLLATVGAAASAIAAARTRRNLLAQAARLWCQTPAEQRLEVISNLSSSIEPNGPAWYMIGCIHLGEFRTKKAARAFGIAHHADCNLETAALLTFACLKAAEGPDSDIVEQIITTWSEMGKPDVLRRRQDRRLLDCLESTTPQAPALPPLGRLAWLVVGPGLRPKVQQLFESSQPGPGTGKTK